MRFSRLTRRIAVTGEASVRLLLTEDPDDGTLLDLSRQGARLRINRRLFEPGQKLALMLNLPWDEPPVECGHSWHDAPRARMTSVWSAHPGHGPALGDGRVRTGRASVGSA